MPNIAIALRQEITRLARKEARGLTASLHKSSTKLRRDIAELKRQNTKLQAEMLRLTRQGLRGEAAVAGAETPKVRFTARSVKSQRHRLGLAAQDYAKLIGVTAHTVYKWEHGTSRPRRTQVAAITALRDVGRREAKVRLESLSKKRPKGRNGKH